MTLTIKTIDTSVHTQQECKYTKKFQQHKQINKIYC